MRTDMRSKRGFTLIELLVVIVIIGVLFAVAMPVFENAGRKNTEQAATQLVTVLRLARQHAINKRQWVVVVFPNQDGPTYTEKDGNNVDKCLRSYAVLAVTNVINVPGSSSMDELERADQIPDNMQFTFLTDWKYLPEGVYFDDDVTLNSNFLFSERTATYLYPVNPGAPNVKVRPMGAMLFRPNGRAYVFVAASMASGKVWQDKDYSKVHVTSAKYYEKMSGKLSAGQTIPGTNSVVMIRNKTGQVHLWDGSQ